MKKHNPNELENMMIDILIHDKKIVWNEIEKEHNALKRCEKRNLFAKAIKKIEKNQL